MIQHGNPSGSCLLFVAVDLWLPLLAQQPVCLLQADALAALAAAARLAGRTPAMNALAAELGLRLESAGVTMAHEHYRGVLNFECDALSRLAEGAQVPARLLAVPRAVPRERVASFFWAWPRELLTHRGPHT